MQSEEMFPTREAALRDGEEFLTKFRRVLGAGKATR
jgi:hypothetical protein